MEGLGVSSRASLEVIQKVNALLVCQAQTEVWLKLGETLSGV
jgi:hypothetical protein